MDIQDNVYTSEIDIQTTYISRLMRKAGSYILTLKGALDLGMK